jgi:hypothetical protein
MQEDNLTAKSGRFLSFWEFVDPKNLFFIILNVFVFIIIQALFWWFVASGLIDDVTIKLNQTSQDYYKKNDEDRKKFCSETDPDLPENQASKEKYQRNIEEVDEFNIDHTLRFFLPLVIGVGAFMLLLFFLMWRKGESMSRIDGLIFLAILAAFGTELFYYFAVVSNIVFIGEQQIASELGNPGSTFEYSTPLPDLYYHIK